MNRAIALALTGVAAITTMTGCQTMTLTQEQPVAAPAAETATAATPAQSEFVTIGAEPMRGVRHIGITVSDIDATLAFYRQSVPFEVVRRYSVPSTAFPRASHNSSSATVDIALVRTPTVFLQLMDFDPGRTTPPRILPVPGPGYTHICYQSPSSAPAYTRFRAAGIAMVSRGEGPVDLGGYGVTYAYGRDPDGTMIEMEQLDRPHRADPAWITHIGITTPDIDRAVAFYTNVVGYDPHRRITTGPNPRLDAIGDLDGGVIRGSWFAMRNFELEIWQYLTPATPQPTGPRMLNTLGHALIAFEVADISTEFARLRTFGVDLIGDPMMMGGWRIQYARDPDGNLFAVQQNVSAGAAESIETMRWLDPASYRRRTR